VTQRPVELSVAQQPRELAELSTREREVLTLVAEGKTNREIAERIVISEATARNHVSHILEKLDLKRRGEAAALAARLGLLDRRSGQ
jgi:DNA-binding NarL/FixJ family response regulator